MNVPRGTPPMRALTRGHETTYYRLRPVGFKPWEREALALGVMTAARWAVRADNSQPLAGTFTGLDLESGRAVRGAGLVELRCRHRFDSGAVRVVRVLPKIGEGDLFWVREGAGGRRADSRFVLEVTGVDVARLQDMTDADALACGVALVPERFRARDSARVTPRDWFARARGAEWRANCWVWVVKFKTNHANIDEYLTMVAEDGRA